MRPSFSAADRLAGLALILLLLGGGLAGAASSDPPPEALTAGEAIACLRTAVATQAGLIKDVEGDQEGGKRLCEVELVDDTGKRHTLHIDVQTNQIVKAK
jgi:hypothetical protein